MRRFIIRTTQSVWLVRQSGESFTCTGRASFAEHMPQDRDYAGPCLSAPRVDGWLTVQTVGGIVTSGAILSITEVPS